MTWCHIRELVWIWLDTQSRLKLVAAGRDPWLQSGVDFGTSEIQYLLYILHIDEEHHANFESICWYLPSPSDRVGEDWRLRGVAPTATRNCSTQQWHSRAIGTGSTGARGRDSPHGEAQQKFRLSSRLGGASRDEQLSPRTALWQMRFIQTYGSGPLSGHTKWRSETHPPAGNALVAEHEKFSEVLERASVFDQLDAPNLSSCECLCRRYQVIEETLRPNEPEAPNEGMEHFMGWPRRRGCGDEPRFVSMCGRPTPQSGSLNGERGSHLRPSWRPVARDLLPLPLPEVLQIGEDAHSLAARWIFVWLRLCKL